jgi:DNA-directed RNA polymerase specialized sigma24 family protein
MFRSANLSPEHFAYKWKTPAKEDFYDYETTNALGIKYANLPEGPEKEALLLELVKCFHGYLTKFLNMVVRGHLPPINSSAGMEAIKFLNLLSPVGKTDKSSKAYGEVCRTLHLAFKQATTDDIYDSLLMCLMRAIQKYDPNYVEKLSRICDVIDQRCKGKYRKEGTIPEFTASEIANKTGMDVNSYLRKLVKRGYLKSISNSKKKVIGYRREPKAWPPPPVLFKSGPVGFTYAVQTYFRFYLHEYITHQMRSIEAKEGMLQLDHRAVGDLSWESMGDVGLPHSEGAFTDTDGQNWAADTSLMNLPLDISTMNEDWVAHTEDKLFKNLNKAERNMLYFIYVKEYSITQIATILGVDPKTVRIKRDYIMDYLRSHAADK